MPHAAQPNPQPTPQLHHEIDGPHNAPLLILGPSLGTSTKVWQPQIEALAERFRTVRFDIPGHGKSPSDVLPEAEQGRTLTMADLAQRVIELADQYGRRTFHYAGISIGGAIGALIAVHHPNRIESLAMIASAPRFGDPERWTQRAELVRREGTAPLIDAAPGRWFSDPAVATTPHGAELIDDLRNADPAGYAACCDAIASYDLRSDLSKIKAPALIVAGSRDVATPPDAAEVLATGIDSAALVTIDSGHIASAEEAPALTACLLAHVRAVSAANAHS